MAKHRQPFLNNDVIRLVELNKEPEQKLWVAVLAKAFDDAFYCSDDNAAIDAFIPAPETLNGPLIRFITSITWDEP